MTYITTFDIAFFATLTLALTFDTFSYFITRKFITKWLSEGMGEIKFVKKVAILVIPQLAVSIPAFIYCLSLGVEGTITACALVFVVGFVISFCYNAYADRKLKKELRQVIAEA